MFGRRHAAGRLFGLGLSMGLLGSNPWSSCDAAPKEQEKKPKQVNFVGVFLDEKSRQALHERFGTRHDNQTASNVVLRFNPTQDDLNTFAPILGKEAKIKVTAYAEDDHTQAALAAVSTEHGDVNYAVECPHITISFTGDEGYPRAYSHVLLERLQAAGHLKIEDNKEGLVVDLNNFEGDLPSFESKLFPIYSPYPSTAAKLTVLEEPLELTGVLCTSATYNEETHACQPAKKAECGFCVFMKAGPCGKEFTAWEACLDESKRKGLDFLQECGPQTLALRDCVDANPEYYSVLNGDSRDEDEEEEGEDAKSTEQSSA